MADDSDLFEQFRSMPVAQLARYSFDFNIFLSNGESEGILIGYLDLERNSKLRVKVLINGDFEHWDEDSCVYVRARDREWVSC